MTLFPIISCCVSIFRYFEYHRIKKIQWRAGHIRSLTSQDRKEGSLLENGANEGLHMTRQRNKVSDMIDTAKIDYYHTAITKAGKDSKILFRTFRELRNDN